MLYTLFVNGFMVDVNAVWMKCESELCWWVWWDTVVMCDDGV